MKIQNQVCTLEQAKKLKELGIRQTSAFHWRLFYHGNIPTSLVFGKIIPKDEAPNVDPYAAFTVAELGIMIPHFDNYGERGGLVHDSTNDPSSERKPWYLIWDAMDAPYKIIDGDTEAEARAAMLIYLLENGVIAADEVNELLTAA